MGFIKNILTGVDNETHDVARTMGALAFAVGLGLQIYVVVYKNAPFSLTEFGAGFALMVTGLGTALKLKETTEPPRKE